MTVPTSNVKFSNIQTEFGGANPIGLGEYRRTGSYVSNNTTSAYGTIPTTLSNIPAGVFRGITKVVPGSQTFTSSGTFTVPNGYTTITIEVWGGGGAGGAGSAGGDSSVSGTGLTTMTAYGGSAGAQGTNTVPGAGGVGGTAINGTTSNITGGTGTTGGGGANGTTGSIAGGTGGAAAVISGAQGGSGTAPGAGGGGGFFQSAGMPMCGCCGYTRYAGGGGAGGYSKSIITTDITPGTTLSVTVGTGGVGTSGQQYGGNGGDGRVIITYA